MPVASSLYSGNNPPLFYGVYTAAGVTLTDGAACAFQFDVNGNLKTTGSGGGGGGGTVTQGPGLGTAASFWTVQLTNGTNYLGTTSHPLIIDVAGVGVQPISATSLPLPTNAAQETGGNLATLAGTVAANKVAISAASLPLPTNAAQETGGNLATIAGAIATSGNAATSNIQTAFGPQIQTLAAWTSSTTTQNITPATGCCALIVQLDQNSSITGGAVTWQGTYDGVNWVTIPAVQIADPTSGSIASIANPYTLQASTNKPFYILLYGYQQIRANLTTPITGAGASVTPYVSQLNYYIQMNPASAPPPINLARYGGSNVVAATSGVAKVGISGAAAATLDAVITAATAPANGLATLAVNNTTAPSLTNGQSAALQSDYVGSLFIKNCRRSQVIAKATTITNSTTATTVVSAAGANLFTDISTLIITAAPVATTAIAFTATLSDGTNSFIFDMDTGVVASGGADPLMMSFDPPLPATTANTAWTLTLSVSTVTVHITANAVLQKAS